MLIPCLPTPSKRAPTGPEWVHEIKHDGYRLIVRRDVDRVRLYTRRGYNWSGRYPLIIDAARRLKVRSIIVDGEAVVCGEDGRSDFDKLHSGGYDQQVVLYAFDLIELDGDDWRLRPLEERRTKLPKLVSRIEGQEPGEPGNAEDPGWDVLESQNTHPARPRRSRKAAHAIL